MDQNTLIRKMWLALIKDSVSSPVYNRIRIDFNNTKDILELIKEADQVAADIISFDTFDRNQPWSTFWRIADEMSDVALPADAQDLDTVSLQKILQLLRFPKRFSPPTGVPSSLPKFWEVNERCKAYNPDDHTYITDLLAQIIRRRFFGCSENSISDDWRLSTGADLEGHKTLGEKLKYLESIEPSLLGVMYGSPIDELKKPYRFCVNKIKSVPKNFKAKRNIAMESQYTTKQSTAIADFLISKLPDYVTGEEQERSQEACVLGSIDNKYSTIDLSSASDSVCCSLCRKIFPTWLYRCLLEVTSVAPKEATWQWDDPTSMFTENCVKVFWDSDLGDYVPHNHSYGMISTMGNRVTFPLEEHVFSAVMEAACVICHKPVKDGCIALCGDDIIVSTDIAATVIDILEVTGFVVNREKSYYHNEFFRESCGVEALRGIDISSQYWPRKVVTADDYPTLIALQHKIYKFPTANDVLTREIRRIYPKVTESYPGSLYDDLWDEYPHIQSIPGSYSQKPDAEDQSCEIHTTVIPVYNGRWDERSERWNYYLWLKNPDLYVDKDLTPLLPTYRNSCNHKALHSTPGCWKLKNRKYLK